MTTDTIHAPAPEAVAAELAAGYSGPTITVAPPPGWAGNAIREEWQAELERHAELEVRLLHLRDGIATTLHCLAELTATATEEHAVNTLLPALAGLGAAAPARALEITRASAVPDFDELERLCRTSADEILARAAEVFARVARRCAP